MNVVQKRAITIQAAAKKAVGKTDAERLKWLIKFAMAGMQRGELTPDDIDRFDEEVSQFVYGCAPPYSAVGFHGEALDQPAIEVLRTSVLYGLRFVARFPPHMAGNVGWNVNENGWINGLEFKVRKGAKALWGPRDGVLLFLASELIASPVGARICACAAPDCESIFYKVNRAAYCSSACAQRTRTRRYRETLKVKSHE
jgi:hypothetical protein